MGWDMGYRGDRDAMVGMDANAVGTETAAGGSGLVGMSNFFRYQTPETLYDEPYSDLDATLGIELSHNLEAHALVSLFIHARSCPPARIPH